MTSDHHTDSIGSQALPPTETPDLGALDLVGDPVVVARVDEREAQVLGANSAFRSLVGEDPTGRPIDLAFVVTVPGLDVLVRAAFDPAGGGSAEAVLEHGTRRFEWRVDRRDPIVVISGHDVSERESLLSQLEHERRHDPVTGLPNSTALLERIAATLRRPELLGGGAAVVVCDLDQYRSIRDALGPVPADEVLATIARRLERRLRFGDCVARLTGDEFAILCCDVGSDDELLTLTERLVRALGEPVELDEGEVYVSATAGVARLHADDATPERVLRDAHAALSKARRSGVDVAVFDESVRADVVHRIEIEKALHRALRQGELRVHYQPLVRFAGADVVGFEALVRWEHPERGLVAPIDFIPIAEETGLIVPIGAWVIEEACRQAAAWRDALPTAEPLVVSVNLSARQLSHPGLVGTIADAIGRHRLDPATLLVEVTESTLMADPQLAVTILHAIRALGVRIAIDDFGTGHSSLAYLRTLPVDGLKIDRSFVAGLDAADDRAIVAAVVSMAHALGLSVTAEGVETLEQLDVLESLGCDVGQGYYFARPQPGDVVGALVRHRIRWRRAS